MPLCLTCSGGVCTQCLDQFILFGGQCIQQCVIDNCLTCKEGTFGQCSQCMEGYVASIDGTACVFCSIDNCSACQYNYGCAIC